ncbi:hypothetical protein AGOR_G00069620 [Albula goreensis]|uniref:Secreted protein n=1 Tax=Albula goreensis TaxID=1534307 RepID=A0A8T3DLR6_9TELE|nr:hypothetical protein AGOR_G00069620 [Albula goreensis]
MLCQHLTPFYCLLRTCLSSLAIRPAAPCHWLRAVDRQTQRSAITACLSRRAPRSLLQRWTATERAGAPALRAERSEVAAELFF